MSDYQAKFVISAENRVKDAVKESEKDFESFGDRVKSALSSITITAGDVMNAVKGIASTVTEWVNAYAKDERALINLRTALEGTGLDAESSMKRLTSFASSLQAITGIGDETTNALSARLIAAGLSVEQTMKLIQAAADYSAKTGESFEGTVDQLQKSLSGSAGMLARFVPEIKSLSKEELAAGAAIDVVAKKYSGGAEALAGSASVSIATFSAAWGDMKEALGGAVMPALQPILQEFTQFLTTTVIPAIQSFGPIVKEIFKQVSEIILAFKPIVEPVLNWFGSIWKNTIGPNIENLASIVKNTLNIISGIVSGDWKKVWDNFKKIVQDVIDIIANAFKPIIDTVNTVIGGIQTALEKLGILQAKQKTDTRYVTDPKTGQVIGYYDSEGKYHKYAAGTKGAAPGWALVGEKGPELVFFNGGEVVIPNHELRGYANGTGTPMGDAGLAVTLKGVADLLQSFGGGLAKAIYSISSIKQLLDPISVVLTGFVQTIEPVVNRLLAPILGMLTVIGQTMGQMIIPLLEAFTPAIEALGKAFVWFYNKVILPVGNFIYKMITSVWNAIASALNKALGWAGVNLALIDATLEPLQEISFEGLRTAGGTGSSVSAQSAQYRSQSITVNIYQEAPVVGSGGMEEFARMIRGELVRLGYYGA